MTLFLKKVFELTSFLSLDKDTRASLIAQSVKNLQYRRPGFVFLGREDPLEKEMATHSSILDWRIL